MGKRCNLLYEIEVESSVERGRKRWLAETSVISFLFQEHRGGRHRRGADFAETSWPRAFPGLCPSRRRFLSAVMIGDDLPLISPLIMVL